LRSSIAYPFDLVAAFDLVGLAPGTDDDIADMVFIYECLLRLVKPGEWVAARKQGVDLAPFDIPQ
jgi:hypothetical protein